MKKKTRKVIEFIDNLHKYIVSNHQFRAKSSQKTEAQIQAEIRPLIIQFLRTYFNEKGYKDAEAKANKSFYWEGEEGIYGRKKAMTFGTRNYPDFIITTPYLIAVEYKKSPNGSTIKQGIGQSIMHTLSGEFHYVYYLFQDESRDKRIRKSIKNKKEQSILKELWENFNVFVKFV